MRRFLPVLVVAIAFAGCDSKKAEDSKAKAETVKSGVADTSVDDMFARKDTAEENNAAAAELFEALKSQLKIDLASLSKKIEASENEQEKTQLYARENPVPQFVDRMLKLVEAFPETPAAFKAALAGLGYASGPQKNVLMNYLLDECPDRIDHAKIVESLLAEVPSPQIENWLRKAIATAPQGLVHAEALVGFKTYFDQLPVFRQTLRLSPDVAKILPAEQLAYINSPRTEAQKTAIATYLQTVIDKYADVKYTGRGLSSSDTFGEVARCGLFELNNLNVGDIAPDIVGDDFDGVPFKLSDYRGKVVMLDFWGHWCPPCRRMYPHEQRIVEQTSGLPFALIGVNSDRKLDTAQNAVRDDKLPWRNFWNGPAGTAGPISKQWNVSAWPTVYLIDGDGVIRYKGVVPPELDQNIEILMAELGHDLDLSEDVVAAN